MSETKKQAKFSEKEIEINLEKLENFGLFVSFSTLSSRALMIELGSFWTFAKTQQSVTPI
jgi:hypothetical protein